MKPCWLYAAFKCHTQAFSVCKTREAPFGDTDIFSGIFKVNGWMTVYCGARFLLLLLIGPDGSLRSRRLSKRQSIKLLYSWMVTQEPGWLQRSIHFLNVRFQAFLPPQQTNVTLSSNYHTNVTEWPILPVTFFLVYGEWNLSSWPSTQTK